VTLTGKTALITYDGAASGPSRSTTHTSSALTRKLLGWYPTHPGLIEDLDEGHYFQI
jgi:hypothetical protein